MDGQDVVRAEDEVVNPEVVVSTDVPSLAPVAELAVEAEDNDVQPAGEPSPAEQAPAEEIEVFPEIAAMEPEVIVPPEPKMMTEPAEALAVAENKSSKPEEVSPVPVASVEIIQKPEVAVAEGGDRPGDVVTAAQPNAKKSVDTEKPADPAVVLPVTQDPKPVEATAKPDPMEVAKALDHDVLEAAFKILAAERAVGLLEAKRRSDKQKVAENSDRVAKFVAEYKDGVRRTTIADKLNMSPSKVTDYLQRLIATGRVRGEGKTIDRRFFSA